MHWGYKGAYMDDIDRLVNHKIDSVFIGKNLTINLDCDIDIYDVSNILKTIVKYCLPLGEELTHTFNDIKINFV